MTSYKILFAIDSLGALIVSYLFLLGLIGGTVSPANSGLWLAILSTIMGILFVSKWLHNRQYNRFTIVLLLAMEAVALLCSAYTLLLLSNGSH